MAWVKVGTATTDADGKIVFDNLPYGDYQIRQSSSKTGYTFESSPVDITINSPTPVTDDVFNTPTDSGTLVVDKFSLGYPDWKLSGAKYKLTDDNDRVLLTLSDPTDTTGSLTFANLMSIPSTPQTYKLIEQEAPTGYVLDPTPIESEISVNTTTTEEIPNTPTDNGEAVVQLADTNYNEYTLPNADFDIYWDDEL